MNKRIAVITASILLLALNASAQLLWKISGNGLTQPSYVFGTHHLIEKEQIKNFDSVLSLCKNADAVVSEMDITDMNTLQTKMMQAGMMTGTTMKDLLSTDDYTLADNEFKTLMGVGLDQLGTMKPMMLNTLYGVMLYMQSNGLTKQPQAVDLIFQKTAKENGKKIIGLETAEQQINILLNSISLPRQAEILMKDIKEKQKGIEDMKLLNAAYLAGDLQKAEAIDKEDDSMTPDEKILLIDKRNNEWMKLLPSLMKSQQCLIAVGFLHLAGDSGLINQLQKAGYEVEAVAL